MRWILESLEAVGHTSSSSAQVTVCSPVAEDHLSLKVLNGIFTSVKSEPTGTENLFLKQPRLNGKLPPPAQAKSALRDPLVNVTRYPVYSGVVDRTERTKFPSMKSEISRKLPSLAALMKPERCFETSTAQGSSSAT